MMKRALWLLAAGVVVAAGAPACSDDAAGELNRGPRGTSSGNPNDPNDPNNPNNPANQVPPEEQLFRKVEPDLQKKCGGSCHTDGTYVPKPPQFLAPPDAYKSIKGYPSAVTKDVYASSLLSKGPHAGPAVNTDPEFEKKLVEWLTAESLALAAQKLPSTPPFQVQNGPNDIDLTPAATGGLTGISELPGAHRPGAARGGPVVRLSPGNGPIARCPVTGRPGAPARRTCQPGAPARRTCHPGAPARRTCHRETDLFTVLGRHVGWAAEPPWPVTRKRTYSLLFGDTSSGAWPSGRRATRPPRCPGRTDHAFPETAADAAHPPS